VTNWVFAPSSRRSRHYSDS